MLPLLALALASCKDKAEPVVTPVENASLGINLRIDTKSSPADGYEKGTQAENYIDIAAEDYRIYFFNAADNTFICRFTPSGVIPSEGTDYTQYSILGSVPDELVSYNAFKVMVIANWPRYPDDATDLTAGQTTIQDVCNADYAEFAFPEDVLNTSGGSGVGGTLERMPFFGLHEYSGVSFTPDIATMLDPVTLIRALAKVELIIETDTYYNISTISRNVMYSNTRGFCAPGGVNTHTDYDHDYTWEEDFADNVHIPASSEITGSTANTGFVSLGTTTEGEKITGKYYLYLPEYENLDSANPLSSIRLMFDFQTGLSQEQAFAIYFSEYVNGKTDITDRTNCYNIERNNIYRFNVKFTGYNYTIRLTVSDWAGLYENSFEYGEGQITSPPLPWDDDVKIDVEF